MTDPATTAARGGAPPDPTGALSAAIQPATTFERDADYALRGPIYARVESPSWAPAQTLLARLEGGAEAALFASGQAAGAMAILALDDGQRVLAPTRMYYNLRRWIAERAPRVAWYEHGQLAAALAAHPDTALVWVETPANPTWEVTDLAEAAALSRAAGARLLVDSTVATPILTRPLALGADLVLHSATKYLNGHGDVVAGALVSARDDDYWQRILACRKDAGAILGAFEAWLLHRGMRTLALRVRAASAGALAVARHLVAHPRVLEVLYPGLPEHPGHAIAARQMTGGFGGMLSFRVDGGFAAAQAVACRTRLFAPATSLGGLESLIEHRAAVEPPESPVPRDLLRLSIGAESPTDLIADLDAALDS